MNDTKSQSTPKSAINRFSPSTSHVEQIHPADIILKDLIENIFWIQSGYYDGSTSSCTPAPCSKATKTDGESLHDLDTNVVDRRLEYWRKFLADNKRLERRIMQKTGKDNSELLMNFIIEHRRVELVKRLMDYAERLRPEKLAVRREVPVELRSLDPCAESVYETLPTTEKTGIPQLTVVDVPKCEEEGLEKCNIRDLSWLKSKYLAERLFCKAEDIRRVLSYFPEINDLHVQGLKLAIGVPEEDREISSIIKELPSAESFSINFDVMEADIEEPEISHEYVVQVNEHVLSADSKRAGNIDIDISFETHQFEKVKTVMLTLKNCGWKTIDFHWDHEERKDSKSMQDRLKNIPAFYFDKNTFRLIPGQRVNLNLMFCTKILGIYTEKWFLLSEPSFFLPGYSFVINLFGHSKEEETAIQMFKDIYEDFSSRAARNMAINLLNIVTIQAIPEPAPKAPYIRHFTEKEIFTNLYPDINYNEAGIEQLKDLYREANIAIKCRCCPEWNYDIEGLKNQILSIDNGDIRKKLYFQLVNAIKKMKRTPVQSKSVYEEQKFLLVKSVMIATMDKIDSIAEKLREVMIKSELPLEFDEVLVLNRHRKRGESKINIPSTSSEEKSVYNTICGQIENEIEYSPQSVESVEQEESHQDTDPDPATVVKSEFIRKKQKQLFMDSLYMQIFAHLGNAAEEIAGVIEGATNLF